ncbi:AMP binding protein [Mycena polygramma]|nr:AMP binding protein [Mycena polygramma]
MAPRIYTSDQPDAPILRTSIFSRLFAARAPGDIGGFPGSQTAFIDAATGTSLTRTELLNLSLSFAHGVMDHPTTAPFAIRGATVLIYAPNSLAWPPVLFGCVAAGLRCTLANSGYVSRELAYQYRDSGAGLLFTAENGIGTVRAMFAELGIGRDEGDMRTVVLPSDLRWAGGPEVALRPECAGLLTLHDLLGRGKLAKESQFEGELAHETVYLCYSSGTTGKPKGVETTHQNMTTILDVLSPTLTLTNLGHNQSVLTILPFYHIYGAVVIHLIFSVGWPLIIQTQFEPFQFCAVIERFKVSMAFIVPPVLVVLGRHPAVEKSDISSLKYMCSAAAPLGADLVKQVKKRLLAQRPAGATCLITQAYGLTETTTGTHMLAFDVADRKVGSIGTLLPNIEARIVDDEEGKVEAVEGAPGELWVRGKTIMKGYLNNPSATADAITPDGWFKTGDIVVKDRDGFYWVVDRRKELIKYKGFQVPPAELESVLLTHPDIADAAVIGIESREEATELPRAYIVPAHLQDLKTTAEKIAFAEGVVKWVQSRVAKHKFLRGGVCIIEAVPKSAAGKILRRELRELAKQEGVDTTFKSKL